MLFTCTQRNLDIHNPVRMINISIVVSDYCILFVQVCACFFTAQTAAIFKPEKNESTVAYYGISITKCQHGIADMAYPPHWWFSTNPAPDSLTWESLLIMPCDRCHLVSQLLFINKRNYTSYLSPFVHCQIVLRTNAKLSSTHLWTAFLV